LPNSQGGASAVWDRIAYLVRWIDPPRSSKPRGRADGRWPKWQSFGPTGAADDGIPIENNYLSFSLQRGPTGSVPAADICFHSLNGCCGCLRRFPPSRDRLPPRRSTARRRQTSWPVHPLRISPAAESTPKPGSSANFCSLCVRTRRTADLTSLNWDRGTGQKTAREKKAGTHRIFLGQLRSSFWPGRKGESTPFPVIERL
jgi:hypothetical protein